MFSSCNVINLLFHLHHHVIFLYVQVGFERDATLLLDNEQDMRELAMGILSAPTRDWARLGWLYLNKVNNSYFSTILN
jgi:hypothetical protein